MTHDYPARRARGIVTLAAPARGVLLWRCDLADDTLLSARLATLSDAERLRAARFGHPTLRDRYILGRGALRTILGDLLGVRPVAVPIVRGARGRPQLHGGAFDFNVSHTGTTALVAVVRGARIGVDIEARTRAINAPGIARKFLSPGERDRLPQGDADAVRQRILKLWTCKEAMSKATGDALSAPFAAIDVDLSDGLQVVAGTGDYSPHHWRLYSANAGPDHIATIAVWRRG